MIVFYKTIYFLPLPFSSLIALIISFIVSLSKVSPLGQVHRLNLLSPHGLLPRVKSGANVLPSSQEHSVGSTPAPHGDFSRNNSFFISCLKALMFRRPPAPPIRPL